MVTSLFSFSSLVIITYSPHGSSCLICTLLEILSPPFQGQSSRSFSSQNTLATQNSGQQSGNSFFLKSATQAPGSGPCSQPSFDVLAHVTCFCFFPLGAHGTGKSCTVFSPLCCPEECRQGNPPPENPVPKSTVGRRTWSQLSCTWHPSLAVAMSSCLHSPQIAGC